MNKNDDDDDDDDDEPDKIPTYHLGFCPLGFCPLGLIPTTMMMVTMMMFCITFTVMGSIRFGWLALSLFMKFIRFRFEKTFTF